MIAMMLRLLCATAALLVALPATSAETLAVFAVGDPPGGPDPDLAELAHQVRAACRDRFGNVQDVPTMRAKLLGMSSSATLAELDRAYGGALAVYQNGEFESAIRTLRAIVDDLENLPESDEAYMQWTRAVLRLAHAAATIGGQREADDAILKLLLVDPGHQPDPDQYSPSYRRHVDELRARVRARPRYKLTVISEGSPGAVFVNGRPFGKTPVVLTLPAGTYRVGGAAGALRVPSFAVDLQTEDRVIELDFALAASLRVNAGPGLALRPAQRGSGLVRAGAWLGADKLVVATRSAEGDAQFLVGSIYDVRRGALLREGSVRMVAGSVPSVNLGALAAFLLTGQSSREVKDRTPDHREVAPPLVVAGSPEAIPSASPGDRDGGGRVEPPPAPASAASAPAAGVGSMRADAPLAPGAPTAVTAAATLRPSPVALQPAAPAASAATPAGGASGAIAAGPSGGGSRPWMRPVAWASGAVAVGFGGLAIQQSAQAARYRADAGAMVGPTGALVVGSDPSHYRDLRAQADAATRNAYLSAGAAAVLAATAGVFGWWSFQEPAPVAAIRF